jgi:hypothetical protein
VSGPAPVDDAAAGAPFARGEIEAALRRVHAEVEAAFAAVGDEVLAQRPDGGGWSAAEHLAHLDLSVTPVARALRLPRIIPRLLFGAAAAPSRPYARLRDDYRAILAAGGRATSAYVPRVDVGAAGPEMRARLVARWRKAGEGLLGAVAGWDEAALDRLRLPHPLLGKLTVREMLFFTVYHDLHHAAAIRRLG